ncbi:MAG: Flp pilus assembly protein CpaB [Phycisphaeraceae bacterium]
MSVTQTNLTAANATAAHTSNVTGTVRGRSQTTPGAPGRSTTNTGGSGTVMIVAIVLGLLVVILTNVYIAMVRSEAAGRSVEVYRFNKELQPGHVLSERRDLVLVRIPEEFADSISGAIGPDNIISWDGQRLAQSAREGDPLTTALFRESREALDHKIADGKRGIALPVNSRNASGLLRPGMLIDILGTFSEEGDAPRTLPVMERVRVVAVGTSTDEAGGRPGTFGSITVEVEPDDAEALLTIARQVGRDGFDIAVRNPREDRTNFVGVNATVKDLIGIQQ